MTDTTKPATPPAPADAGHAKTAPAKVQDHHGMSGTNTMTGATTLPKIEDVQHIAGGISGPQTGTLVKPVTMEAKDVKPGVSIHENPLVRPAAIAAPVMTARVQDGVLIIGDDRYRVNIASISTVEVLDGRMKISMNNSETIVLSGETVKNVRSALAR